MKKIRYLIILLLCVLAQGAWAQEVKYIERKWVGDDTNGEVQQTEGSKDVYTEYSSDNDVNNVKELSEEWYVFSGSFSFSNRVKIRGTNVHIILKDGCNVEFKKGIHIEDGKTLTIYGQKNDSGKLRATGDDGSRSNGDAAIGGNNEVIGGNLVIHGGYVYAYPYHNCAAGIGGGDGASGMRSVTIYGGTVEAQGRSSGAGIGCGEHNDTHPTVKIYGGTVKATGGDYAAGIGGGEDTSGGYIYIYGGTVNATSGNYGAGIGGGQGGSNDHCYIYGGTVTATGKQDGAGIGGGEYHSGGANTGYIEIWGGNVTATGGAEGAGIGGGEHGGSGTVKIYGGTIKATAGQHGSGIGGGKEGKGAAVYIYAGTVTAKNVDGGWSIGGGKNQSDNGSLTLGSTVCVRNGGASGSLVSGSNRKSTLWSSGEHTAMDCTHNYTGCTRKNSDKHTYTCSYCDGYDETHIFESNKCTKCGSERPTHTWTFYESNANGSGYDSGTAHYAQENETFTFPEGNGKVNDLIFVGWEKTNTAPANMKIDDPNGLYKAGEEITVAVGSGDQKYYARYIDAVFGGGKGTAADPFIISTVEHWNNMASIIENYRISFSGCYFKLTNDISVTTMAGTADDYFEGNFDGDGHTLTVSYDNTQGGYAEAYMAPFRYVNGITVQNLTVAGTMKSKKRNVAGFMGYCIGDITVTGCRSSVEITCTMDKSSKGYLAGFISQIDDDASNSTIEGCVFDGSLTGANSNTNGGFVGKTSGTVSITNGLFIPTSTDAGSSKTFVGNGDADISNSYYTTNSFGTLQGKRAYTVVSGTDGLTLNYGNREVYANKLSAFSFDQGNNVTAGGLLFGGKLYTGTSTKVTFTTEADDKKTVTNVKAVKDDSTGADYSHALADNGNDSYTLTMASENAKITATLTTTIDIVLYANEDNSTTLTDKVNQNVKLSGTTLKRDGTRQTICLPFGVTDVNTGDEVSFTGTPLEGFTVMEPTSCNVVETSTLAITCATVNDIVAGKPYIIMYMGTATTDDIVDPVFEGVTINSAAPTETLFQSNEDKKVGLCGTYALKHLKGIVTTNSITGEGVESSTETGGDEYHVKTDGYVSNEEYTLDAMQVYIKNYDTATYKFIRLQNTDNKNIFVTPMFSGGTGESETPYLIGSDADFWAMAHFVNDGHNFSGTYFKLTADVSTETMVGTSASKFAGIFDGDGHTLNVNISSSEQGAAPFHYISGATIKNLVVTGTVTGSAYHAGGLVGFASESSTNTIENCLVSTNVSVNILGSGVVGHATTSTLNMTGCVYDGTITNTASGVTDNNRSVGGLVGWCDNTKLSFTNSLFAGTYEKANSDVEFHPIAVKNYNKSPEVNVKNTYYTVEPDEDSDGCNNIATTKATRAYTVESGTDGLTLDYGTTTSTDKDFIKVYDSGMLFNGKFYAAAQSKVTFTAAVDKDKTATGLVTTAGELANNGNNSYTLTMGSDNAVITATIGAATAATTITLNADADNSTTLSDNNGKYCNVTLSGTTLKKNRTVQTLCLPFDVSDFMGTPLEGFTVYEPVSGKVMTLDANNYYLVGCSEVYSITAGKPYILKWTSDNASDTDITNPTFSNVTISNTTPTEVKLTNQEADAVGLTGTYTTMDITVGGSDYNVDTDGKLNNTTGATVKAQEVYIHMYQTYEEIRLSITPVWDGDGTEDNPYEIANDVDFAALAYYVNEGEDFSGKFFKMTHDVTTTMMVGESSSKCFSGTFDGDGYTLTANLTATENMCAPFRYIGGATIKNLKVDGTIAGGSYKQLAGLVGSYNKNGSTCTISNCVVSTAISTTYNDDSSIGGLFVEIRAGEANVEGCAFTGSFDCPDAFKVGGLVGWMVKLSNCQTTLHLDDCLFAPTTATFADAEDNYPLVRRRNNGDKCFINNCYYTNVLHEGNEQGTKVTKVTSISDSDADIGDQVKAYGLLTAYKKGIACDSKYYVAEGGENITFADNAVNDVASKAGTYANVTLKGRTLWKDGSWNTLCLPFDMTVEQVTTQLASTALMELDVDGDHDGKKTGLDSEGTLYLYFKEATTIEAGKPYIVKWDKGTDSVDPQFTGIEVSNKAAATVEAKNAGYRTVQFIGNYSPERLTGGDKSNLYLGTENKLYYPSADKTINAFRAYFHVDLTGDANVRSISLHFGDDAEQTGIKEIDDLQIDSLRFDTDAVYDLQGRKIENQKSVNRKLPRGVYIYNGRKIVVK